MPDIHYIVVNYFNDNEIMHFVNNELQGQNIQGLKIYIVNNGSVNNKVNELNGSNIRIFTPRINLGYLPALSHVYENVAGNADDVFILSNTDITIGETEFLSDLIFRMKEAQADVFGPAIISEKYKDNQNPFYTERISSRKIKFLMFVFDNYLIYLIYQLLSNVKRTLKSRYPSTFSVDGVYAIHGSFMVFNNKFMSLMQGNKEKIPFLFTEELFIAELARKNGLKVSYDPNLVIRHREHTVTGNFKSKENCKRLHNSLTNLYNEYFL